MIDLLSNDMLDGLSAQELTLMSELPAGRRPRGDVRSWSLSDVAFAWTQATSRPFVPLHEGRVDEAAYRVHWRHCRDNIWLPLFLSGDVAMVVSSRPHQPALRREVAKLLRCEIYWAGCAENDFDRTVAALGEPVSVEVLPPPVVIPSAWNLEPVEGVPDPYRPGVVSLLHTAHRLGASDVFLDDDGGRVAVRFRLSGVAEVFPPIPLRFRQTFMSALKRMAAVNPNARSQFHDARFAVDFADASRVDIRAAFAPSIGGETVALRIQDSKRMVGSGMKVPLPPDLIGSFNEALSKKGGMILVTGPTGSGKTTTLYAALLSMDRADLVIRTIEDPVEYTLPGITQVAVGGDTGRTFGGALRSFLRLNPDVILVGEIRDEETALLALEASLTGHTLLSTLHAPDCTDTLSRYADMVQSKNVLPTLSSTLSVVLSQRLAPRLCQRCREPRGVSSSEREMYHRYGLDAPGVLHRKRGCPECGTGVRGRVPVLELLVMTPALRDIMASEDGFSTKAFRRQWISEGGRPMGRFALELAAAGLIEFEEAKRHAIWVPEPPQ